MYRRRRQLASWPISRNDQFPDREISLSAFSGPYRAAYERALFRSGASSRVIPLALGIGESAGISYVRVSMVSAGCEGGFIATATCTGQDTIFYEASPRRLLWPRFVIGVASFRTEVR